MRSLWENYIKVAKTMVISMILKMDNYFVSNEEPRLTNQEYEKYFQKEMIKYQSQIHYEKKTGYECFRRVMDLIVSLIALLPVTILILILAVFIRLDSPGNPIFTQVRVGKNGKLIKIHKLRSMVIDAESEGQRWAADDDPRVTKIGRVLRKYRFDEIPQFYDVLLGRLSLIGPRPEIPILTQRFNEYYPGFVTRLLVTPGISGWAQINGGYAVNPHDKWQLDQEYIENRSIGLYFKIFFRTIGVVARGEDSK